MSDAMTDINRYSKRSKSENIFLYYLLQYLKEVNEENKNVLYQKAEECDSITGGYFSYQTSFKKNLDRILEPLEKGDKKEWSELLSFLPAYPVGLIEFECVICFKEEFQKLSPFDDNDLILSIDYGFGFSKDIEEFQNWINKTLQKNRHPIYRGQKYTFVIENPVIKEIIDRTKKK